jgi:salicylate hydroxylase
LSASAPVLIAGAGIGGLAAALALANRGLASHVVEKRAAVSEEGAGIQIGPNGVHALRRLGIADALAPLTASPDCLRVMDGVSGRELTQLPLGAPIERRHGAPYWTAHRADLHAALLQAAAGQALITLSLGVEVTAAATQASRVKATCADGSAIEGRALIVADGLWSRLRERHFKAPPLQYAGRQAYRAVVSADLLPSALSAASTHIWLSPDAHAVHYPVRQGQDIALVVVLCEPQTAPGWGQHVASTRLQQRFATHAPALRKLISQPDSWRGWPLMTLPGPMVWTDGPIALLGDAAHPILPFLAQGAVMALEDAVALAAHIAAHPHDTPLALQRYAAERQTRTGRVARASLRNGRTYHLSGLMATARNAVLRAAPPQRLLASYDWLYGHRSAT